MFLSIRIMASVALMLAFVIELVEGIAHLNVPLMISGALGIGASVVIGLTFLRDHQTHAVDGRIIDMWRERALAAEAQIALRDMWAAGDSNPEPEA